MTTVYSVMHSEGIYYTPTKAEALRVAKDAKEAGDIMVSVQRIVVTDTLGKRELYCALLNGESWAAEQVEVDV